MPEVAIQPILLSDIELTIGLNGYAGSVSSAALVPSSSIVTWKGMKKGSSYSFPTDSTWQLNLNFAQDWEAAQSLSNYLLEHAGDIEAGVLAPKAGGQAFGVALILVPGQIGGDGDTVATAQVSLGVSGAPEKMTVEDAGKAAGAALTQDADLTRLASDIREQVTGQPLIPRQ